MKTKMDNFCLFSPSIIDSFFSPRGPHFVDDFWNQPTRRTDKSWAQNVKSELSGREGGGRGKKKRSIREWRHKNTSFLTPFDRWISPSCCCLGHPLS